MNESSRGLALGLERIVRHPKGAPRATPLLFVHGAYAGAWCWDEFFLPWFAEQGFTAHAFSVRGHGGSDGDDRLDAWGIDDYVSDLGRVIAALPAPPVVIGHSMGGYLVQKYLEKTALAGAVLMASVPPSGLGGPTVSLTVWNPVAAMHIGALQAFGLPPTIPDTLRGALFSGDIAEERAQSYLARMGRESRRAMLDMFNRISIDSAKFRDMPLQVLGAAEDGLIPAAYVRATARALGVEPVMLDELGHVMMLDHGWERVARCILDWLEENGF